MGNCLNSDDKSEKTKAGNKSTFNQTDPMGFGQKTGCVAYNQTPKTNVNEMKYIVENKLKSSVSSVSATNIKFQEVRNQQKVFTTESMATTTDELSSSNISRSIGSESASGVSVSTGSSKNAFVALFDYAARTKEDLSFKKGDILYIDDPKKAQTGWIMARLKSNSSYGSGYTGYIPIKYIAELGSLESQPWYFGSKKRMEAEKLLMLDQNTIGSFLIRISDGNNHAYSLSVRDQEAIKHYRIHISDDRKYYITKRVPFSSLNDLVSYYSSKADGLWVQLMRPCVKLDKPITEGLTHLFPIDFEVDRKLFVLERKIGQGQFGDVWQGVYNSREKVPVAIKTLKEGMNSADFKAEAAFMKELSHEKLIQLYALCTTEEPIYIVTELMVNGSLLDYLQTPVGKRLELETQIYIATQIADGMAYLESKKYIHRDLAARNVLVGLNNEVKVADFGLARVVKETQQNIYSAREGTKFPIKWTAPEAAIFNKFSVKSDVWSFGIVLTEIITHGRTPYPSMSNQEVLAQVSRNYRMPQPSSCPTRLYELMLICWKHDPEERPTFEALKYKLETYFDEDINKQYRDTHSTSHTSANF